MEYQKEAAYLLALVFPMFTGGSPWLHGANQNVLLYDSVEVKIVEETYDPAPSYTRHVGERVKRSADAMPNSLHFLIRYGSRQQNIRMRRNAFGQNKDGKSDVPDFPVFIIENGRIKRKELQHDKDIAVNTSTAVVDVLGIALYSNESTGSSFMVRKRSNRADFIFNGVFYDGLDQLSLTRDAKGGLHQIHKQNGVVDFRNDYIHAASNEGEAKDKRQERVNLLPRDPHDRSKRQLMHAGENEVQLFMIADNKDYKTWLKYYRQNSTLTQIEMNLYYAFIANSMNVRYSSIKTVDSSFSLKIIISGLLIVNSQKVSTWTEDNLDPLTHCVDAARALESFRMWIKSTRHDLPPSDHWMLFTGFDISTDGNRNVAGLAKLGGMCSSNSVSLIEQDNTGSVGATAAHELGHSLSALHDGEEKDCIDEDNYIMSRKLKTPDEEVLASRPWQFSPCSVRAFKRFISESKCTQKSVRGMSVLSTSLSPGQVFSADLQCQLALGNGSYFGRSLQLREGYPSLCRRMWCAVPEDPGFYQGIFALENTSCGDGKWCQQGQCVPDPLAPRMEDSCPQGDDPTAPCALEDCPYYTNRTKLVYCCHTCRQLAPWQEDRPLVEQVVRQIEVLPMTLNRERPQDAIDVFDESTLAPVRTRPEEHHQASSSTPAPEKEQSPAPQGHTTQRPPLNDPSSKTTAIPDMSQIATSMQEIVELGIGIDSITTGIPDMSQRASSKQATVQPGLGIHSITTGIPDMSQIATSMQEIVELGIGIDSITTGIPDMSQRASSKQATVQPGLGIDSITTGIPDMSQRASSKQATVQPGLGIDSITTGIPDMSQRASSKQATVQPGLGIDSITTGIPDMSQRASSKQATAEPGLGIDSITTGIPVISQRATKMPAKAEPGLVDDHITTGIQHVSPSGTYKPTSTGSQTGVDSTGSDNYVSQPPAWYSQQITESSNWASVENTTAFNDFSTIISSPRTGSTTETSVSNVPALTTSYISTTNTPETPQMIPSDISPVTDDETFTRHAPHEVLGDKYYTDIMSGIGSYRETTIVAATSAEPAAHSSSRDESTTPRSSTRTRPGHGLYNMSGPVSSNITLPSLLFLLMPDMNATWHLREEGQILRQTTGGVSASPQSHVTSGGVLSAVSSVKSRNKSFEDNRHGGHAEGVVDKDGRQQHMLEIINRISGTNHNKTFQQPDYGNGTHTNHQTLLSLSNSLNGSMNITAASPGGLLNTNTGHTHADNYSFLASGNSSLRSSNANLTHSSQDVNLTHNDYLKQTPTHFHLRTNKIDKNADFPSVAGQSLVHSDELGSQGQVVTDSLQGYDLLQTALSSEDHISQDNRSASEQNQSRDSFVNTSLPVHKLSAHENRSPTSAHALHEDGRLYGKNRTQTSSVAETLREGDFFTRNITTASLFRIIINNLMSQSIQMSQTVSVSPRSQSITPQNHLQHSQANSVLVTNYRVPARAAQDRPTVNHLDLSLPVMVYTHSVPVIGTVPVPKVNSLSPHISNKFQDVDPVQTAHVDNDISQNVNRIPTVPQDTLSSNTAIDHLPVLTDGHRNTHLTNLDNNIPKEVIVAAPATNHVVNGIDHNVHILNLANSGTFWNGLGNNGRIQDGGQYLNKPTV